LLLPKIKIKIKNCNTKNSIETFLYIILSFHEKHNKLEIRKVILRLKVIKYHYNYETEVLAFA
ncbi:MAG: hypothetical protein C0197_06315, partial [Caldimicrobium thiodismutans]